MKTPQKRLRRPGENRKTGDRDSLDPLTNGGLMASHPGSRLLRPQCDPHALFKFREQHLADSFWRDRAGCKP